MNSDLQPTQKMNYPAQAVVELALALPILMLVIVGLVEFGRMMFIYGMVTTASREAARYGTGVGSNALGTPYYLDCDGIKQSALAYGQWGGVDASDVLIYYDEGPNSAGPFPACPVNADEIEIGDRVIVEVLGEFQPVPQMPFFNFPNWTFSSVSSRTIVKDLFVAQAGTAVVDYGAPTATPTMTATPTATVTATPTVTMTSQSATSTVTMTPTVTLAPPSAPLYPAVTWTELGSKCMNIVFYWGANPDWANNPNAWPEEYQVFQNGFYQASFPEYINEWETGSSLHDEQIITLGVQALFAGPLGSERLEVAYQCEHGELEPLN